MIPILYRGKSQETGKWINDTGIIYDDELCTRIAILDSTVGDFEEVKPMTVSQFTGLYDCKGKEIFENDVVRVGGLTGVVMWHPYLTCFCINADGKEPTINDTYATLGEMRKSYRDDFNVIGNVYDEELKDGKWKKL